MPNYSDRSKAKLQTCDKRLQDVFEVVIQHFDNTILCGHRPEAEQNEAFDTGHSKVRWPDGKHNTLPSRAVDATPYPIDWKDRERMTYFAGFVVAIGAMLNVNIRWGGDWDQDTEVSNNNFDDLVHFELVD